MIKEMCIRDRANHTRSPHTARACNVLAPLCRVTRCEGSGADKPSSSRQAHEDVYKRQSLDDALFGTVFGYLSLWSVFWLFKLVTGKEGMGYGDFKLLAMLGAWGGWQILPLTILLSSLVGAILGAVSYTHLYRVRFRTDGMLHEVAKPPIQLASRISARLKVMAGLDISERRKPQDGRIKMRVSKTKSIDFRVNTLPTLWGEKLSLIHIFQASRSRRTTTSGRTLPSSRWFSTCSTS